jgi:hypothetical protein
VLLASCVAMVARTEIIHNKVKWLVGNVEEYTSLVRRETDNDSIDRTRQFRADLFKRMVALARDWPDAPGVKQALDNAVAAIAASEKAFGDKLVIPELLKVEKIVLPYVERVERALAMKMPAIAIEYAPRLRSLLHTLAPFLAHQRAKLLHDRGLAALSRLPELGADTVAAVDQAEALPDVAVADRFSEDETPERILDVLVYDYHSMYQTWLDELDDSVELDTGEYHHVVAGNVDNYANQLVRLAQRIEDAANKVGSPAALAVPGLVERAQATRRQLKKRLEYVDALGRCYRAHETALERRQAAIDMAEDGVKYEWLDVLARAKEIEVAANAAIDVLPDLHDEADAWLAKAAAIRDEVRETMERLCVAEVSKLARMNNPEIAEDYAQPLRQAFPDSPVNAEIAGILSTTGEGRAKALGEVKARAEVLKKIAASASRSMHSTYDQWAEDKSPIQALAGTIVADIERYRGKWVAASYDLLGLYLTNEPYRIDGDFVQLEFHPDFKAAMRGGLEKLDGIYEQMAKAVAKKHDADIPTTTQHYPRDATFVGEITGITMYTPRIDVKDGSGRVLGTIDGTPYPIPTLTVHAARTTYCTIVPGEAPSTDSVEASSVLD